jgi:uncharacterized protein (TIGR03083 family)
VALLRGLDAAAWSAATVCRGWSVQDIAAHLLDTACRRLSHGRDGHRPPAAAAGPGDFAFLVRFLDDLNAEWVRAARRLSARLLTDALEWVEPQLAAHLAELDPRAEAALAVAWAGEKRSANWFDVARELTERWHHQQQIRLAVGAAPLADPELSRAVFDTFLRALPHRYRAVDGPEGLTLAIVVRSAAIHAYALRRHGDAWRLLRGAPAAPEAAIELEEEVAWRLFTKGLDAGAARRRAEIRGDQRLAGPFFEVVAVMA